MRPAFPPPGCPVHRVDPGGGGLLSDRISIRYALPGNFLLMFVGTMVLSFSGEFAISLLATLAVAAGMGLQNAIVFKLLPHHVPDALRIR